MHKTSSLDTQHKRNNDYMTTEGIFFCTTSLAHGEEGCLDCRKWLLNQGITKHVLLLKKRFSEVVFELNH